MMNSNQRSSNTGDHIARCPGEQQIVAARRGGGVLGPRRRCGTLKPVTRCDLTIGVDSQVAERV
jgi:hypothetical protein